MNLKISYFFLVILSVLSCNTSNLDPPPAEEEEEAAPLNVNIIAANDLVEIGKIPSRKIREIITCTGRIAIPPTALVSVHSKVNGQVSYLKFLPGDFVKKGELLAKIENPKLLTMQRSLLETKANLDFAQKDFDRKKTLKAGQAIAEKLFDESQNKYDRLKATYYGLKEELILLGIDIEQLERHNTFQSNVAIYAATTGYIHEVLVNMGQWIDPEDKLLQMAGPHLHLELQVLPKDIRGLEKGQQVKFTLPNSPTAFAAEVVKINPMVNVQQGTLQVHCHIKERDKKVFVSGVFVNALIEKTEREVAGLPVSAVLKEGEEYFAFKIEDEVVVKTTLQNANLQEEFVVFDNPKEGLWVIEGAYYVE